MGRLVIVLVLLIVSRGEAFEQTNLISKGRLQEDVSQCSIERFKTPLFYVSSSSNKKHPHYENLRMRARSNSSNLGRVPVGSLVVKTKKKSVKPGDKSYMPVFVGQLARRQKSFGKVLKRPREGYLWGQSVERPDAWAFKVNDAYIRGLSSDEANYLDGKVIKAVKHRNHYTGLRCCQGRRCQNYPIFAVYENNGKRFVSHIAFSIREMDFVKKMQAFKLKKKMRGKEVKPALAVKSSRTQVQKSSLFSSRKQEVVKKNRNQPLMVSGNGNKVICTKGSPVNVRNDSLRRVLFKSHPYETVTPYQGWGKNKKKSGRHTYIKVHFAKNNKVGWVAEKFVVFAKQCSGYQAQKKNLKVNKMTKNSQELLVCSSGGVSLRNQRLRRIGLLKYKAKVHPVKTSREKTGRLKGKSYTFIKVSHKKGSSTQVGWVAKNLVKGQCPVHRSGGAKVSRSQGKIGGVSPVTGTDHHFLFPISKRPTVPYIGKYGTSFGWRRSGGNRRHAACDLKRPYGEPVRAISDGTVLRNSAFYSGTNAIEVKHSNGEVVRYGEVSRKKVVHRGDKIKKGQVIGYVGRLNSGNSMLHFELYTGELQGKLTRRGNRYKRRSDLRNPSQRLLVWEKQTLK